MTESDELNWRLCKVVERTPKSASSRRCLTYCTRPQALRLVVRGVRSQSVVTAFHWLSVGCSLASPVPGVRRACGRGNPAFQAGGSEQPGTDPDFGSVPENFFLLESAASERFRPNSTEVPVSNAACSSSNHVPRSSLSFVHPRAPSLEPTTQPAWCSVQLYNSDDAHHLLLGSSSVPLRSRLSLRTPRLRCRRSFALPSILHQLPFLLPSLQPHFSSLPPLRAFSFGASISRWWSCKRFPVRAAMAASTPPAPVVEAAAPPAPVAAPVPAVAAPLPTPPSETPVADPVAAPAAVPASAPAVKAEASEPAPAAADAGSVVPEESKTLEAGTETGTVSVAEKGTLNVEDEKAEQEKAERLKAEQEKAEQEKLALEKAAEEKAAQEKAAQEKAEQEKIEHEKLVARVKAWEEETKSRIDSRNKKEEAKISAEEVSQKSKAEARLKKNEEKLEKQKLKYMDMMKNEVAAATKQAEEKRASVAAKKGQEILKTEETAAKITATGIFPKKFGCFAA